MLRQNLLLAAFGAAVLASTAFAQGHKPKCGEETIGSVWMDSDRVLHAMMTACSPDGTAIGDTAVDYKKGDPGYDDLLQKVGGLTPGQSKTIPAKKS
ncbi:hypothetical protein ACFSM5_10110 [Lacibacterium aquatile]|uniref:Uncharacterized protein n=1 Tax=Lacibacterium aquatile TaxID=1168082 RepID=A0ABW5DUS0_9PROT